MGGRCLHEQQSRRWISTRKIDDDVKGKAQSVSRILWLIRKGQPGRWGMPNANLATVPISTPNLLTDGSRGIVLSSAHILLRGSVLTTGHKPRNPCPAATLRSFVPQGVCHHPLSVDRCCHSLGARSLNSMYSSDKGVTPRRNFAQ